MNKNNTNQQNNQTNKQHNSSEHTTTPGTLLLLLLWRGQRQSDTSSTAAFVANVFHGDWVLTTQQHHIGGLKIAYRGADIIWVRKECSTKIGREMKTVLMEQRERERGKKPENELER